MLLPASKRHCLSSWALKPGFTVGRCRALQMNPIRPLVQPVAVHQLLLSSYPLFPRQYSTSSPRLQLSSQLKTAAQQNNQIFKLSELFNVKDKVVLITGGGSGIGLMATQALAVNGAKVYIVGRRFEKLERVAELYGDDIPGQIIPINADVTKKEEVQRLIQEIESREKHVSILINNAGISSTTTATEPEDPSELRKSLFDRDADVEDWENVWRTNVYQIYLMTTAFLPLLQKGTEAEYGFSSTVINISSISGIIKTAQHHFAYNASKAAAIHLTKMMAHEIASSKLKIRINNIAPGVFPSEMTAGKSDEKQKSAIPREKYASKVPAGRPGHERDMANAVLFTATNQYLNGQTVVVDGGYVLAVGTV